MVYLWLTSEQSKKQLKQKVQGILPSSYKLKSTTKITQGTIASKFLIWHWKKQPLCMTMSVIFGSSHSFLLIITTCITTYTRQKTPTHPSKQATSSYTPSTVTNQSQAIKSTHYITQHLDLRDKNAAGRRTNSSCVWFSEAAAGARIQLLWNRPCILVGGYNL